jgi:hypothetical protein
VIGSLLAGHPPCGLAASFRRDGTEGTECTEGTGNPPIDGRQRGHTPGLDGRVVEFQSTRQTSSNGTYSGPGAGCRERGAGSWSPGAGARELELGAQEGDRSLGAGGADEGGQRVLRVVDGGFDRRSDSRF